MPPPEITVSLQQMRDLVAGRDIQVSYQGKVYVVSLGLIRYALTQFQTGGEVFALVPTWVDGAMGPMEELLISA
jgi:hypothetical protein